MSAVKDWQIEKNLKRYEEGKQTLWQAANKCGLTLWEMIQEAKKRAIKVPYTLEDLQEEIKGIK